MLRKALSLSSVIVLSLVGAASAGEDSESANAIMRGCRMNPRETSNITLVDAWERGHCVGIITGLDADARYSGSILKHALFCPPEQVTYEQELRVVVAYIDKHPERMHERFTLLAMTALAVTSPCKD
jgi:hypothetical protein